MRVYHFLQKRWALDDIERRRIKISELDQLNDPFELWCVSLSDKRLRTPLQEFKGKMGEHYGIICFSKQWSNPLLWSHYADKHRGICLGFEADDRALKAVSYVAERADLPIPPTLESMQQLLFTKFQDWQYEEEWRNWFRLDERDGDHYFYPFDERVQLREVIAGPLCDVTETQISEALGDIKNNVAVIKAGLAFKTFRIVRPHWHFDTESG
jgi:hypothetical protein